MSVLNVSPYQLGRMSTESVAAENDVVSFGARQRRCSVQFSTAPIHACRINCEHWNQITALGLHDSMSAGKISFTSPLSEPASYPTSMQPELNSNLHSASFKNSVKPTRISTYQ